MESVIVPILIVAHFSSHKGVLVFGPEIDSLELPILTEKGLSI